MLDAIAWFLVLLGSAVAILAAIRLAQRLLPDAIPRLAGRRVIAGVVVVLVALLVLCLALRIHGYAELDGRLIAHLSHSRSAGLAGVFTVITTMGDTVPSLLIATSLAMAFHLATGQVWRPVVLPVVVLVELAAQFTLEKVFGDPTVGALRPDLVIGGAGPIPSGSVARLLSIFLVAAMLWAAHSARTSRALVVTGSIVVLVEITSRLYLSRHFVTDIVGGLLLGILLVVAAGWAIFAVAGRPSEAASGESPIPS